MLCYLLYPAFSLPYSHDAVKFQLAINTNQVTYDILVKDYKFSRNCSSKVPVSGDQYSVILRIVMV